MGYESKILVVLKSPYSDQIDGKNTIMLKY